MHTPSSRGRAALVAGLMAASLKIGGQREIEVRERPEVNLADQLVKRAMQSRFYRDVLGGMFRKPNHSKMYSNGGQRRKRAIRARRMNNAGHGNRWSSRHA